MFRIAVRRKEAICSAEFKEDQTAKFDLDVGSL